MTNGSCQLDANSVPGRVRAGRHHTPSSPTSVLQPPCSVHHPRIPSISNSSSPALSARSPRFTNVHMVSH